ncbi:MAG: helix-turn-helix domain-containing protein [Actinomycetota bacterium]
MVSALRGRHDVGGRRRARVGPGVDAGGSGVGSETSPFGSELRTWRRQRRMSQLDLAIASGTTTRHLSFLETGRSRPSAVMVERLVEALDVPVRHRNAVFEAAGLRGPYDELGGEPLASEPFRLAIESLLERHDPFPGFAFDRAWDVVLANRTGRNLLFGEQNLIRLLYGGAWQPLIENWSAVAWSGLVRLRRDALRSGERPEVVSLVEHAERALTGTPRPEEVGEELVVCPTFVIDGARIPTVTITARFGAARTAATDELQVELIYPADDVGRELFASLAPGR